MDPVSIADQARELIREYRESEWRSTRLDVLRRFGPHQDSRSLQFLMDLAKKNEDLAEQQLAILALSQRRSRAAQIFLRQFYRTAPDTLKPTLAYALGQVQDFSAAPILIKDWDTAYARQNWLWLRNIILALGDLKAFEALPKLRDLMVRLPHGTEEISTWFALGRLERDPAFVKIPTTLTLDQSLAFQTYQSALSQIQIRAQFKLEDYLHKIFLAPDPHPILPLELKAFDPEEVVVGLSLFSIEQHWRRYLFALRGVRAKERVADLKLISAQTVELDDQLYFISEVAMLIEEGNRDEVLALLLPFSKSEIAQVRLAWLTTVAPWIQVSKEAPSFLLGQDSALAIQFLNIWSEWQQIESTDGPGVIDEWLKKDLPLEVRARLIRACAELSIDIKSFAQQVRDHFEKPAIRSSFLIYLQQFPEALSLDALMNFVTQWKKEEQIEWGLRVLSTLDAYAEKKLLKGSQDSLSVLLKGYGEHFNLDLRVGVLQLLRHLPNPEWEAYIVEQSKQKDSRVQLNAIIALKYYPDSRVASEAIAAGFESTSLVIQGRALDALCAHRTLLAKRAVIEFLQKHLDDEVVVDKVYRSFDPDGKGGAEFAKAIEVILEANPEHPQWEKLVSLRDRLGIVPEVSTMSAPTAVALKEVDDQLLLVIPFFQKLDATTQSALRAAEQPFLGTLEIQNLPIDKAPIVLEYCKALDLILERHLGQKHFFSKLETQLHDFQTLWHRVGFGEDYPSSDQVISLLGLKGKITHEHFPLHKAKMMCGTFFNGKILQDRFKVFDGLRAWAVIFLIFTRKITLPTGAIAPLVKLNGATDEKCVSIAKRLMMLQDLRNPAAHRQTYVDMASVKTVRNEAIELINTVLGLI